MSKLHCNSISGCESEVYVDRVPVVRCPTPVLLHCFVLLYMLQGTAALVV